jgi:protein-disulfide isomerase
MIGDLLCSDCLTAWPNVKSVVAYYNQPNQPSNLRFVFHTFPLPYHHYAYASAQGASIVKALAPSRVFDWIDAVYANQATFYNEATAGMTSDQVNLVFAKLANTSCGVDPSAYLDLLQNYTVSDQPVRISFKYAASRAVVGTPTFWVNGIPVNGDPTWGVAEWRQIIDPLLPGTMEHELAAAFTTAPLQCPPTTKSCQFLPGKFECCVRKFSHHFCFNV